MILRGDDRAVSGELKTRQVVRDQATRSYAKQFGADTSATSPV